MEYTETKTGQETTKDHPSWKGGIELHYQYKTTYIVYYYWDVSVKFQCQRVTLLETVYKDVALLFINKISQDDINNFIECNIC